MAFPIRRIKLKYVIIGLIAVVLYNEFLIYWIQPLYWQRMECKSKDKTCTKILLIADPQIQGDRAVPPPLSWLYNWDSDRYLEHTFAVVMNYFEPDILIYLGDLMDEGSQATKLEFKRYIGRLINIFYTNRFVMQIWVPGDNDIGGENERVSMERLKLFKDTFSQPDVIPIYDYVVGQLNNIVVYKLNRIAHIMPTIPDSLIPEDNFNIIVSHYTILGTGIFAQKAIDTIKPKLMFSGHDHTAKYVESPKGAMFAKITRKILPGDQMLEIDFNNETNYEIVVPTCSYRMGVPNMGFGAAILEKDGKHLKYQVLWSPRRFPILFFYAFILAVLTIYVTMFYFLKPLYVPLRFY